MKQRPLHTTPGARWAQDTPWRAAATFLAGALAAMAMADARAQAATSTAAANASIEHPVAIQAPYYGDALWRFYQGRTFHAITGLMVSQQTGRIQPHDEEAEVLRGGMLLAYGLHNAAHEVFATLLDRSRTPSVHDRAWYYLARIRHQRGLLAESEAALDRVVGPLPVALEEDRLLLAAQLRMAAGDFAGATQKLRTIDEAAGTREALAAATARPAAPGVLGRLMGFGRPQPQAAMLTSPWLRFNLGVAWLRQGDSARGAPLLQAVGKSPVQPDEGDDIKSLRDQANLALGYWALQQGEAAEAREHLSRVRLHSLQSNRALLGFGWADITQNQPKRALVAFAELASRDPSDPAVLEARIALPHAYAELGASGQAQTHYAAALQSYSTERSALAKSVAAVKQGAWIDQLLQVNPGEELGWFWQITQLPGQTPDPAKGGEPAAPAADAGLPHPNHLAPLLAQHEFQEALKNLRDLGFLQRNLAAWRDTIAAMHDLLAHRERVFAQKMPEAQRQSGQAIETSWKALQARRDELAASVQEATTAGDGKALASAGQMKLLATVNRVRDQLALMTTQLDPAIDKTGLDPSTADKLRLAEGLLTWDLAREHPVRLRDAQQHLQATDDGLTQAQARVAAIERAQQEEPARRAAFTQRLQALDARIAALQPVMTAQEAEQRSELQALAAASLLRQGERLDEYTVQAQFALAQLLDRAVVSQGPSPEPGAPNATAR